MPFSELTRRALFHWLLLLGVGLPTAAGRRALGDSPSQGSNATLLNVLKHPERAAIVGREYLRLRPEDNDERRLTELLGLTESHATELRQSDVLTMRCKFLLRHQHDFRTGKVVNFHGWILSATELRLCALLHLHIRA
jgi:hypothetical protein